MAQDDVLTEESTVDEPAAEDAAVAADSAGTEFLEEQEQVAEVEAATGAVESEDDAAEPEANVKAAGSVDAEPVQSEAETAEEKDLLEEDTLEATAEEGDAEAEPKATVETEEDSEAEAGPEGEVEAEPDAEDIEYDALVPLEDIPDDAAWYVIHTYSGYENKVKRNLEYRVESSGMQHQIFRVVVPVEEEVDIKEGQRRVVERRVFPGYVFVQMLMDDEAWHLIHNTPGVTSFVGSGTKPTPLRDAEVERILRRIEAEEPTVRVSFREGQRVRIVDGPFSDFHGMVDEIDMERGKVRLLVSFFGRETPVELDLLQVEKG
jgi:transcriptional antiterminator NusG